MQLLITENEAYAQEILNKLLTFNAQNGKTPYFKGQRHPKEGQKIGFYLTDENEKLIAGANAVVTHSWLHVEELLVDGKYRGQHLGSQILSAVEDYVKTQNLVGILLETHEFQALAFYQKNGFEIAGKIPDFPPGNSFYSLIKRIN